VGEDFNKGAFIDIRDFESDDAAIDYIMSVINNADKLKEYLEQPVFPNNEMPFHATPECLSLFLRDIM
jgi:hypothetical protein